MMNNAEGISRSSKMEVTIKGHRVTLHFADEPNPDVAVQVKQVLLSTCLLTTDCKREDKSLNTSNFQ